MSDPFIAEVRIFAGNFAPRGWAFCNGQLLPIAQNTALFSLLGTIYGGDGRTTVGLPNLQGRAPMHPGNGPGLTSRRIGESGGTTTETIAEQHLPSHNHTMMAAVDGLTPGEDRPAVDRAFAFSTGGAMYQTDGTSNIVNKADEATPEFLGGGGSHNNIQPLLGLHFIIALQGVFPSRN